MYYVMRQSVVNRFGWDRLRIYADPEAAQRLAKNVGGAQVWEQHEYDQWYQVTVTPLYAIGDG